MKFKKYKPKNNKQTLIKFKIFNNYIFKLKITQNK